MSIRKFPFWDKLCTCSAHRLWTAFHLTGPGAPLFLSPPISWPLCHFLSFHHHLPTPSTSTHPSDNSIWTLSHSVHIFSFFGQTFGTPTCVHPSPMDNIQSDWAQSPFIPITIHLLTFVPILAHPPIHLPTPATPNSIHLPNFFFLDTLGPSL